MNKSRILEEMHITATGLNKLGLISNATMRDYDKLCIPLVHMINPIDIKKLREREKVSQAVFAALLNTSVSTVQKWEIGQKKPSGIALKLLNIVENKGLEPLM